MSEPKSESSLLSLLPWICGLVSLITVFAVGFGSSMYATPFANEKPSDDFDSSFYDILMQQRAAWGHEDAESPDLLHVNIDDSTLEAMQTRWPLTRKEQAVGYTILKELGAKQVVFDIEYLDQASKTINTSHLDELKIISSEAFDKIKKIVLSDDIIISKKNDIKEITEEIQASVDSLAPDVDAPLAYVLEDLNATIGIHSIEIEDMLTSPEQWAKYEKTISKFDKDLLWIEKEGLVGDEEVLAQKMRVIYLDDFVGKLTGALPWRDEKNTSQYSEFVDKWPDLEGPVGIELLNQIEILYKVHQSKKWVELNNSVRIEASESNKKIIVAPHFSLVKFWSANKVNCGLVEASSDPDGKVRRVPLFKEVGERRFFQLALRGLLSWKGIPPSAIEITENQIIAGNYKIPLEDKRWFRINWTKKENLGKHQKQNQSNNVSFYELYRLHELRDLVLINARKALLLEDEVKLVNELFAPETWVVMADFLKKNDEVVQVKQARLYLEAAKNNYKVWRTLYKKLKPQVENKLAFVGLAATSSTDRRATPIQADVDMVYLQATVADNIMRGAYLRRMPSYIQVLFIAVVLLGMSLALLSSNFKGGVFSLILTTLIIFGAGYYLVWQHGLLLRGKTMLIGTTSLFVVVTGVKQLWDFQMRTTLGKTLSPNIVEYITEHPSSWEELIEGRNMRLTVLFSDIKGFTKFCEGQPPDEVKRRMNQIMDRLSPCILEEGGTVDKFMGDCVMAFFGAPVEYEDHAIKAIRAAQKMRDALNEMVMEFQKEGLHPLDMGIGISTGDMTIGNFGSSEVEDFSVIGDAVNLGSRIEGLTRSVDADILISEETYNDTKHLIESEYKGEYQVKGKSFSVKLWKFCGVKF